MNIPKAALCCCFLSVTIALNAQVVNVNPQVRTRATADGKVTVVEVAAHFVTAVRLPEAVNAVAIGDPALFQVEHSEREPDLVLVKALTERSAESNLLISGVRGRQFSLLLVSRGIETGPAKVDFLLQYKSASSFLVEPEVVPFPMVGQTAPLGKAQPTAIGAAVNSVDSQASLMPTAFAFSPSNGPTPPSDTTTNQTAPKSLDSLLLRQQEAPLPTLYGERIEGENVKGDRLRTGISEVIDCGQEVIVLFSVVNTSKHAILLMPPQVQLGGKNKTGRIVKHDRWSAAEQLPVGDFRLSRRRVGVGGYVQVTPGDGASRHFCGIARQPLCILLVRTRGELSNARPFSKISGAHPAFTISAGRRYRRSGRRLRSPDRPFAFEDRSCSLARYRAGRRPSMTVRKFESL